MSSKRGCVHKCMKKGHYSSQCFSKTTQEIIEQLAEDPEIYFLVPLCL